MSASEGLLDFAVALADVEPRRTDPPLRSAEAVAVLLAATLNAPEVATYAEHDPQSRHRLWLYADGCMFRLDVAIVARRPAR